MTFAYITGAIVLLVIWWWAFGWKGCVALLATFGALYATEKYGAPWMIWALGTVLLALCVLFLLCHFFNFGWCRTVGPWLAAKAGGAFRWVRGQTWRLFVFCAKWLFRTVFITFWKWTALIALGAATYFFWGKFSWMTWLVAWFAASLFFKPVRDLYKKIIVGILRGIASWLKKTYLGIPLGWRVLWTAMLGTCICWLVYLIQGYAANYSRARNPVTWVTGFWDHLAGNSYHVVLLAFAFGLVVSLFMLSKHPKTPPTRRRARA